VNVWVVDKEKLEPMELLTTSGWIMYFTFDPSKNYLWTAGQKGNISEALISPRTMFDKLSKKLKRDMTIEEWNFFVGRNVPYESFIELRRKGVSL
jgi:hypothetical protein